MQTCRRKEVLEVMKVMKTKDLHTNFRDLTQQSCSLTMEYVIVKHINTRLHPIPSHDIPGL